VLGKILISENYQINFAQDGQQALDIVDNQPPDIILLDIMMPGMNGFEVIERLKSNSHTKDIPVIFITARGESEDEVKGLRLGAVDYITKPIKLEVVLARVKTHLSLVFAHRKLEHQNRELIETAKLREDIERITRHDIKTPLNGILGIPQLLIEDNNLRPEQVKQLKLLEESGTTMLNMINLSLDLFKMERKMYEFQPVSVDIIK